MLALWVSVWFFFFFLLLFLSALLLLPACLLLGFCLVFCVWGSCLLSLMAMLSDSACVCGTPWLCTIVLAWGSRDA